MVADKCAEEHLTVVNRGVGSQRNLAGTAECSGNRSFRLSAQTSVFVVERFDVFLCHFVVSNRFNADSTLTRRRKGNFRRNNGTNAIGQTEALQTGCRHHEGVVLSVVELRKTSAHVTANHLDLEVRETGTNHQFTTKAGGADNASGRHLF